MRAYEIYIYKPGAIQETRKFSSFDNGLGGFFPKTPNPGALNIEFDIPVFQLANPSGAATLKIWGVGLGELSQALNYVDQTIVIWGGMAKGLPLAKPSQYGLLLTGRILQCYGNWEGTNQTLDFVITSLAAPVSGIAGTIEAGQSIGESVYNTLHTLYPNVAIDNRSSPNTKLSAPEPFMFQNITQYAQKIYEISKKQTSPLHPTDIFSTPTFSGINISFANNKFTISDGTQTTEPKQIEFVDLIGQPTWHTLMTVQFKTVLRADINVDDYIQLPDSMQKLTAQTRAQYKDSSIFKGKMRVSSVRHAGNFRQPTGDSWVTVIEANLQS